MGLRILKSDQGHEAMPLAVLNKKTAADLAGSVV